MPDQSEVENVLVSVVTQIVYPNGLAADSATGDDIRVFRGWPIQAGLDADLRAGIVNISVFPLDMERNVTRYDREWLEVPAPPITLTTTVAGNTVTIGGKPRCPLNAAVLVNNRAFVHPLQATDTTTSIATALAAQIRVAFSATSNGPVITIPGATKLQARVGAVASIVQEVKRQKKGFRITAWCANPEARDAISAAIDSGLSSLTFLSLSDGTSGRIRYERTHTLDGAQRTGLYRRDLDYSVEYATTVAQRAAEIVAEEIDIDGGGPQHTKLTI